MTAGEGLRLRGIVRCTPRAVWAVTAAFAALLPLYALLVPLYHGPDETKHVDMLFAVRGSGGWPGEAERSMNLRVVRSSEAAGFDPGRPARSAGEALPRADRPRLSELAPDVSSRVGNQMWQHPPLGYVGTATALAVVTAVVPATADWSHDQVIGFARLLNAVVLVPLPVFAYGATRRLAGAGPAARAGAVLAAAVPGAAHVGATVTNDALLVALVGLLTMALVHVATGDLSLRTATVTGVVAGLALLTKGFALFAPAWIGAAYALAVWRAGAAGLARVARPAALAAGVTGLVGGWWWLRNLLDQGVIQPRGSTFRTAPPDFVPDVAHWLARVTTLVPHSFWGYFGWVEAPLPDVAAVLASAVLAGGLVLAVAARPSRVAWRRADVVLLLGAAAGTAAIMLYGSWTIYASSTLRAALHGRYVMPGLVGLAAAAGLGLAWPLPRRARRLLPAVLLMGAASLHVTAFAALLRRYWMPAGSGYSEGIRAALAWSPWPPAVTAAAAALAAGAFTWAFMELVRAGAARRAPAVSPDAPTRSSTAGV